MTARTVITRDDSKVLAVEVKFSAVVGDVTAWPSVELPPRRSGSSRPL